MFDNHSDDGLFRNPDQQETGVTLDDIKSDTASIASILNKYGGKQVEMLKKVEQGTTRNQNATQRTQKQSSPNKTERLNAPARDAIDVVSNGVSKALTNSVERVSKKRNDQDPVKGTGRDANGRFTSKQNQINEEKSQSKILSALGEIGGNVKDSVDTENIDPTVDALKELKGAFDVGKAITTPLGRGFGGLFRQNKEESRWYTRFFKFYSKRQKDQEKHEDEMEDLGEARSGSSGSGLFAILAGLFGFVKKYIPLLGGLSAIGTLLGKLLSMIGKLAFGGSAGEMVGSSKGKRGQAGSKGKTNKKAKSTRVNASKIQSEDVKQPKSKGAVSSAKTSKLSKLSKGGGKFLKRIPLLGTLLTGAQLVSSINDDTVDENGISNRSKGIGGSIGGIVGGAIGTLGGPMGTVAGGIIGDIIGTKLGAMVSEMDFSPLDKFDDAIDSMKGWFGMAGETNNYYTAPDQKVAYSDHAYTGGKVTGLDRNQTSAIMRALAMRESGGQLDKVNKNGYLGQYQFGAQALVDAGLIDRSKFEKASEGAQSGGNAKEHMAFLNDPSNWTIKGGKDAFLQSRAMQDKAVQALWNQNAETFKRTNGRDFKGAQEAGGWLMSAHLTGAGGANNLYKDQSDKADGYGTHASEYRNLGVNAIRSQNMASISLPIPVTPPKAIDANGMSLPATPSQPYSPNVVQQRVSAETSRQSARTVAQEQRARTEANNAKREDRNEKGEPNSVQQGDDSHYNLLVQDVSTRNIAHVVTGGITGQQRSVM